MITRFRVQNYKALRDVTLDLTPVHVLIGPNDSGKTSLLQAIEILSSTSDHPLREVIRPTADRFWYQFEVSWEPSIGPLDQYQVTIHGDIHSNNGSPQCRDEKYLGTDGLSVEISHGFNTSLFEDNDHSRQRFSAQGMPPALLSQIRDQLSGVQFYRFSPESLKMPVVLDARRQGRMEVNGLGLPQLLDEIRNHRNRFDTLEQRFCEVFSYVESIELIVQDAFASSPTDHRQVQKSEYAAGKGIQFRLKNGKKLLAGDASDGMFLVLAYLALLNLPSPPRLLLIEEPENGIHPARLKEIIRILKQLVSEQSHTQVLMTTHSPYVLHEFLPEEVTVCVREQNGEVKTRRLSDSKAVQEQMDFFSLGEIWTMEGDEALIQPVTDENVDDPTGTPSGEVQPAS